MADYIYKVFRENEWREAQTAELYLGSSDDMRDGFIHLSTRCQLEKTIAKHFQGASVLYIARYKCSSFPSKELQWEVSRDNTLFPHLYGPLSEKYKTDYWRLEKAQLDQFDYTVLPKDD